MRKLFIFIFICAVKAEVVEAGCRLPQNFSGDWVNTANMDADVFVNETHIIETWYPDEARFRRTIYVCREQRGSRYMMARLTVDGWYETFIRHFITITVQRIQNVVIRLGHENN